MNANTIIGIDLAKNIFEITGADASGKNIFKKRLKRGEMAAFFAQFPSSRIAMEACGGAHHWARMLKQQGHSPQLIAAQYVKPFKLTVQKNDRNDAQAIVEAALRPLMKFVAVKTLAQQDLQSLHRVRKQLIDMRVMIVNQIRGLLMEYGITLDEGFAKFKLQLADALEDANTELTPLVRSLAYSQYELVKKLVTEQDLLDKKLENIVADNEDYNRLKEVPGVGINTASMFIASVGDANVFKNGRHVAAWLGLVPRQTSSGEKKRLGCITKAGDSSLRSMLVQGARAALLAALRKQKPDPTSQWAIQLLKEKGWNKATVALANKNARVMFHILKNKVSYKMSYKVA